MLDDLRNHDPFPTEEEQRWIAFDDVGAIARAVVLAFAALAIGVSASAVIDNPNVTLGMIGPR